MHLNQLSNMYKEMRLLSDNYYFHLNIDPLEQKVHLYPYLHNEQLYLLH